jgi:hypothetical protein
LRLETSNRKDCVTNENWEVVKGIAEIVKCAVVLSLLTFCLPVKADRPVFGSAPDGSGNGLSISFYNSYSYLGGAVEFTPAENFDLGSISLWLEGYNTQYAETVNVSIWLDNNNTPYTPLLNFDSPAANNGSLDLFTFSNPSGANSFVDPSDSTVLSANTTYWLIVTASGSSGGTIWAEGKNPCGQGIYIGSDSYSVNNGTFDSSSIMPAFSINVVPEPGFTAFMTLSLCAAAGYRVWKNRR